MSIRFAQVVHFYPNYNTCELVMMDNGQRFNNALILNHHISSNSGVFGHHAVLRPPSEEEAGGMMFEEADRTIMAAVMMASGRPMVVGFLPHPKTQMAFIREEQNRDIYRHPAGNVVTTDKAGNMEVQHTGGAFIRIARDSETAAADRHEDLTPRCANENWTLPLNEPVTITICTGNQGEAAFKLRVRPNGDTDIMSAGNLNIRYQGNAHIDVGGNAEVHVEGDMTASVGRNLDARAGNDVTATAGSSAHLLALGNGYMASAGPALVGSLEKLTLEAPAIEIVCDTLDVTAGTVGILAGSMGISGTVGIEGTFGVTGEAGITGTFGVEGSVGIAGTFGMEGLMGVVGIVDATEFVTGGGFPGPVGPSGFGGGGAGSFGGVAAEIALANEQIAAQAADMAEAAASIEAAVSEAVETSKQALGWGDPDNEGLSGDPAPDVP